jgi:FMN phosphatase YigB (HAD superfamily)
VDRRTSGREVSVVLFDFGETLVEWVSDEVTTLSQQDITAFADSAPTLDRLKRYGHRLAVISNTTQSSAQDMTVALGRLGLDRFFDVVVTSYDVGVEKPDPAIFRHALGRLGLTAAQAAMVGNDISADVGGAAALGMITFLIARDGATTSEGVVPTFTVDSLLLVPDLLRQSHSKASR